MFEWLLKVITFGWYLPDLDYRYPRVYGTIEIINRCNDESEHLKWRSKLIKKFGLAHHAYGETYFYLKKKNVGEAILSWIEKNPPPVVAIVCLQEWANVGWLVDNGREVVASGKPWRFCDKCGNSVGPSMDKNRRCISHPKARTFVSDPMKSGQAPTMWTKIWRNGRSQDY